MSPSGTAATNSGSAIKCSLDPVLCWRGAFALASRPPPTTQLCNRFALTRLAIATATIETLCRWHSSINLTLKSAMPPPRFQFSLNSHVFLYLLDRNGPRSSTEPGSRCRRRVLTRLSQSRLGVVLSKRSRQMNAPST